MKNEVVKTNKAGLPVYLVDKIGDVAGMGNSTDARDNTLPYLAICQQNSPQLDEGSSEYIKGIKFGDLFNTATSQFWDGKEGIPGVPIAYQKALVEWIPRTLGGGHVATYPIDDKIVESAKPRMVDGKPKGLMLPNGNDLVETAYTFVLLPGNAMPLVIGASSSALGPMRDWMALRNSFMVENSIAPSFSRQYLIRTVRTERDNNTWYNWKVSDLGWVDQMTFERGLEFARKAAAGDIIPSVPSDGASGSAAEDDGIPV